MTALAYQALYRKYRPVTFSDVVGQEHITETLKNELAEGKTVHAYLFTGTRGTGKTSCAKILARAINCNSHTNGDPCLECASCKSIESGENTDIVEIDAASNNGVDNIRELRELIGFAPANSKYRVYIIDEVHMLSLGAFNALLKTLEEPPAHVVFILATTEVHKLPATILSRCQRFDFKRISSEKIAERMKFIAEKEGLTITDDAATLIAASADGGMRDALSILDLCASSSKDIDEAIVESVCAMAGNEYLLELASCIKSQNTEQALLLIDKLHKSSVDMLRLLSELTSHFRDLMIVKTVKTEQPPIICSATKLKALKEQASLYDISEIMQCLNVLQASFPAMQSGDRRCEMEMAIIRMCNPKLSADISSLERRISALEQGVTVTVNPTNQPTEKTTHAIQEEDDEIPLPTSENEAAAPKEELKPKTVINDADDEIKEVQEWQEILKVLTTDCPLIAGVLKDSKAYTKGAFLLIDAPNSQFRSLINSGNAYYKDSIRKAAQKVLGVTYKLGPYNPPKKQEETDPLTDLANRLKQFEVN